MVWSIEIRIVRNTFLLKDQSPQPTFFKAKAIHFGERCLGMVSIYYYLGLGVGLLVGRISSSWIVWPEHGYCYS